MAARKAAAPTPPAEAEDYAWPPEQAGYAAALIRERDGYARYGRKDRAAEVDAELDRLRDAAPLEHAVTEPPETA